MKHKILVIVFMVVFAASLLAMSPVKPVFGTTETRYMRSDSWTVNGNYANEFGSSQSSGELNFGGQSGSAPHYIGIRVLVLHANDTTTDLTSGTTVAVATVVNNSLVSATWNCPQTSLVPTDSIEITLYANSNNPPTYSMTLTFITEELGATSLNAATWTVYYYTFIFLNTPQLYFGDSTYNSRVTNFQWTPVSIPSTTVSYRIPDNTSDAERRYHTDYFACSGSTLEDTAGDYDNVTYYEYGSGMHFSNIAVPAGVTINNAYITFYCRTSCSYTDVKTIFHGEKTANPNAFSTEADFDGRTRTTASVLWDNSAAWTAGQQYNSTAITTIVSEIVGQAGWASGNNMTIFWDDFAGRSASARLKEAYAYSGNFTGRAMITITYTPANNVPTIGQFSAPATVYAYQTFNVSIVISDLDGAVSNYGLRNATLSFSVSSIQLNWFADNSTSKTDPSSYGNLAVSYVQTINSSALNVTWSIQLYWTAPKGAYGLSASTIVYDWLGASSTCTTGSFTFVSDLIVKASPTLDKTRYDPSSSAKVSGQLYYQGTTVKPYSAAGITAYIELSLVTKGSNASIGSDGSFQISFTTVSTVPSSSSYNVYSSTSAGISTTNQSVSVIVDRVNVLVLSPSASRLNVNSAVSFTVSGTYQYDNTTWSGTYTLNDTTLTKTSVAKYGFSIASVTDSNYGLTTFLQNATSPSVIWDRVNVLVFSAVHPRINVNSAASFTVSGTYQYDNTTWSGSYTLNDTTTKATVGIWYFNISAVTDSTYGLTAYLLNSTSPVYVIWDRVTVTLSPASQRISVSSPATITSSGVYQYDSAVFPGSITLNDTTTQSVIANYTYTTLSITGDAYGITVFTSNNVSVVFDKVKISTFSVVSDRININATASFTVAGVYWFDSAAWSGPWGLNESTVQSSDGRYNFTVNAIGDAVYNVTAFNMTVPDLYVIWDSLQIYNSQPMQTIAPQTYKFQMQIRHGSDLGNINNASVGLLYPNGTILSSYSNTSGWVSYVFSPANITAGTLTVYGINDNAYSITISEMNVTFNTGFSWTLISKDIVGNSLANTTFTITSGSTVVWSGGGLAHVPSGSYNVSVSWLQNVIVNTTLNVVISGDTSTSFNCSVYPFTVMWGSYSLASNATITSEAVSSNTLTVAFSGATSTYLLVSNCTRRPSFILGVAFDESADMSAGYLVLPHYGNATLTINYDNWGDTYVSASDQTLTSVSMASDRLTVISNGTGGIIATLKVYCGSRGNPITVSGLTVTYGTPLVGTYVQAGPTTVWMEWSVPTGTSGGGTGGSNLPALFVNVNITLPSQCYIGDTVNGTVTVDWSGYPTINLQVMQVGSPYGWTILVAGLPLALNSNASITSAVVPFVLVIPSDLKAGKYQVPYDFTFGTSAGPTKSMQAVESLTLLVPIPPIPDLLTYFYGAIIAAAVAGFLLRTRRNT